MAPSLGGVQAVRVGVVAAARTRGLVAPPIRASETTLRAAQWFCSQFQRCHTRIPGLLGGLALSQFQPFRRLQRSRMTPSFAYPLGARIGRLPVACSARVLPAPSLGQVLLLRAV